MAVAWVDDFNIGVIEIDQQHENIMHYINQLAAAHNRAAVSKVLEDLLEYTALHFKFERHMLAEAGLGLADLCKYDQTKFIEYLAEFIHRHDQGEDITDALYTMLTTWLIHHVKRDHAAYVAMLRGKKTTDVAETVQTENSAWMNRYFYRLLAE